MYLNCDAHEIKNWEITPEGFMKLWVAVATANKDLVYNKDSGETVTEFINKDNLFNKSSINSAVGKHLTFNHPPEAISGLNWKEHSVGVALQEYSEDGDSLLMASMIYELPIIEKIKSGEIKYTSSGYSAAKKKELNQDGKIEQLTRSYNHFALLGDGYQPRAGYDCSVRTFGLPNKDGIKSNEMTNDKNQQQDSPPEVSENKKTLDIGEVIRLYTEYGEILKAAGFEPGTNQDAVALRKKILNHYYPSEESRIEKLNNDSLEGFWINFEFNKDLIEISRDSKRDKDKSQNDSFGSPENSPAMNTYIARLENRPVPTK